MIILDAGVLVSHLIPNYVNPSINQIEVLRYLIKIVTPGHNIYRKIKIINVIAKCG